MSWELYMARLFGTDGIRGVAGRDLTAELAFHLGESTGMLIDENGWDRKVIIGGDSRISGPMLESALASGLMSRGIDVHLAGIAPTPAIAFLTKHMGFPLGCVISASHNPIEDNGIKFFDSRGMKADDEVEDRLEALLEKKPSKKKTAVGSETGFVTGEKIGRRYDAKRAIDEYVKFLNAIVLDKIQGLSVVIDGAFGAASAIAPAIFSILGTRVVPYNCQPDGSRINVKCGATHPEGLQLKVREMKADIGIALDGDADRAILVDEKGQVIDGDQVLAMWGRHLLRKNALPSKTVVGTVLSNKGLEVALEHDGGKLLRAPVGDKFVLREMLKSGAIIGGEQSGHIIFLDHHTTGDGILTGLMVAVLMRETNKLLSQLGSEMSRFPQVQLNIEVKDKKSALDDEKIKAGVAALSKNIEKSSGRLLIRPSGTESVIRVMTEAPDESVARKMAEEAIGLFKPFSESGKITEI
jgi:phosphoglucosamine mutase